jgi:NADH-quinone oxidoreductase subunit N
VPPTHNPVLDWHALAPEIILAATVLAVLVADLVWRSRAPWRIPRIAATGTLAALIPVVTLANNGDDRSLFTGAYVVDNYSLVLKGFFILAAYVTILISVDYIGEGDYYKGEYYFLLLTSVLGMSVMASARDLVTLFVALETISLPTYVLAGFRKHDRRSNEAAIKYYVIGVLSSAIMLYGFSLIYGVTGTTLLSGIAHRLGGLVAAHQTPPLLAVALFLSLVGFAFKVSAVPFHFWAPDTYEGAPTPVTAFLSVASKAGGFVAMLNIVFFGFATNTSAWWPVIWFLAAASMTLGNLAALRQTNLVRMLAYSSVAQGGFMLVPFAAAGANRSTASTAFSAVVVYLLIYGAMNFGAFAVLIAVARRTGSAEISSYNGLFATSPGLALAMTLFLASLAGIPPLAGWFAKFVMFRAVIDAGGGWPVALGIIAALNSVVAFWYYSGPIRAMFFEEPADAATRTVRVPGALLAAIGLTVAVVVVVGVYPEMFARLGDHASEVVTAFSP